MIVTHYSGLRPLEIEINIGDAWNEGLSLKQTVNKYKDIYPKQKIVQYWDKFHCAVGIGNKYPECELHGTKIDTNDREKHSEDWLKHHGYI